MSTGGLKRLVIGAAAVTLTLPAAGVEARIDFDAWRAERAAAREARFGGGALGTNELFGPAEPENTPGGGAEQAGDTSCRCSARLSLASPDLQFTGSGLVLTPRVNVSVRTRGEAEDGDWTVDLAWQGGASFTSDDVTVPGPAAFSGQQHLFGGQCGDNRYSYRGLSLGSVPLASVSRSLFGADTEMDGTVRLAAQLTGCDPDDEYKQFPFTVADFGNLSVRGWRSVR